MDCMNGVGASASPCGAVTYCADQVVLVRCDHVREMRGETDEVLRRTRSEEAENAVLKAVKGCGDQPDWFVERWIGDGDGGMLVACAVFEDEGRCARFADEVRKVGGEMASGGGNGDGKSPVSVLDDEVMRKEIARYFTAEMERIRSERMAKYRAVVDDAAKRGAYGGRVVVGRFRPAEGKDAKSAFEELAASVNGACGDGECSSGISYSGFWDGEYARFCFGFADLASADDAKEKLDAFGATVVDALGGCVEGVDLEMAALVIAKMQADERERDAASASAVAVAVDGAVKSAKEAAAARSREASAMCD